LSLYFNDLFFDYLMLDILHHINQLHPDGARKIRFPELITNIILIFNLLNPRPSKMLIRIITKHQQAYIEGLYIFISPSSYSHISG